MLIKQGAGTPATEARERIVAAAERLFAEKGYAATSVQEITEAAEVNKALLYYYFEDKHSVYQSLIDSGIAELRRMVEETLNGPGTYTERLRAFVRGHVQILWSRSNLLRVVHRCLLAGEQEEVGLVQKFEGTIYLLVEFLAAGMRDGEFRPMDPGMTARSLIGITDKFACIGMVKGQEYEADQVVAHVTDLFLHGLRRAGGTG